MRHIRNLIWLLVISGTWGCTGTKNRNGFAIWMNQNKPMLSAESQDCSGNTYTCTYVPRAWVACESEVPVEDIHNEQVLMEIQLAGALSDAKTFNERLVQYADLTMKNDLTLQYGNEERRCQVVQVESNFLAAGHYKFILFFEGIWNSDATDPINVIYRGTAFGCKQPVEITFDVLKLSDIPQLDCKN